MREQRASAQNEGLSGNHMELLSSYVAEATGPPPRSPLRFWIDGEWVEMPSPEPELVVESIATPVVPEPTPEENRPAAEPEDAPTLALATAEVGDVSDADEELHLPIYEWFAADGTDQSAPVAGWPWSLVDRRPA